MEEQKLDLQGKTAAVLPASGIGDALLMMIASYQLQQQGCQVTTFHPSLPELFSWFPGQIIQTPPSDRELVEALVPYDLILIENDNSPRVKQIQAAFPSKTSIFYPTYRASKHPPLSPRDRIFDSQRPMAENIACAIASLLNVTPPSKENGLTPPASLAFRAHPKQVLLHPTSRVANKNWSAEGFLDVARQLKTKGFRPLFCVAPTEKQEWNCVEKEGFDLADIADLSALAALIYESGFLIGNDSLPGHLASNLGIPALIIANDVKRMALWQPGWLKAEVVLPPPYLPNWRWLRLRGDHWQRFISPGKVLGRFDKLRRASERVSE